MSKEDNNNNSKKRDFIISNDAKKARIIKAMYRQASLLFIDIKYHEEKPSKLIFVDIKEGKLNDLSREICTKITEELSQFGLKEIEISLIASFVTDQIPNNIDKLEDLINASVSEKKKNKKQVIIHLKKDLEGIIPTDTISLETKKELALEVAPNSAANAIQVVGV